MKQADLERRLAKATGVSVASARDEVDEAVRRVLTSLRQGRDAELPGLGRLTPKASGARKAPKK